MKKRIHNEHIKPMKCSVCGKDTNHYLTSDGEYKCVVCQNIDKIIPIKEVNFESDFDDELPKIEEEKTDPELY
jgi:hypothetical protein